MRLRRSVLLLLAPLLALSVLANEPPSMKDQYVTTYQNVAATFVVRATDPDIDPLHPDAHPLTFVLLQGPVHGVIVGDFADVLYEGPHAAVLRLRYVPAEGYVGTDYVVLTVLDPLGLSATGTTTIQIDVRPRTRGALSGFADGWFTYNVQSESVTAFRNRISEVYRIGPLTLQGAAEWLLYEHPSDDVEETKAWFDLAELDATVRFDRLSLSAAVVFEPSPIQTDPTPLDFFDYALFTSRWTLWDASFTHTAFLDREASNSYQSLVVRATWAGMKLASTTLCSMDPSCGFAFRSQRLAADWLGCEARLRASLTFTDSGFDELYGKLDDYPIPGLSAAGVGLYLDLTAHFATEEKTIAPTFSLKTPWIDCVRAYGEVVLGAPGSTWVDAVSVYGLRVRHQIGDIGFESSTSFSPSKNASMTGQVDYFELLRVFGSTQFCCGVPGLWSIATYFQSDHTSPFGWGMTVAEADFAVARQVSTTLRVACRTGGFEDPVLELTLGWRVRW